MDQIICNNNVRQHIDIIPQAVYEESDVYYRKHRKTVFDILSAQVKYI